MSLKSIRESYSKLLTTFNDAGVKLNESQKADLDTFVMALESTMTKQREAVIKKTQKAVTEKLENQYKVVFESIMKNIQKNNELAAKIQQYKTRIDESRKIADKVDNYLSLYVESVLPKKEIIDYDRMRKLEKIQESLKDVLLVNDDAVEAKKQELAESFKTEKSKCETEVAKLTVKLNESMAKSQELTKKLNQYKALELLESKTKDLPSYEARQVKKLLAEATVPEIEANFNKVLSKVHKQIKESVDECSTFESEISKIVDSEEDQVDENSLVGDRPHNLHQKVNEKEDETEKDKDMNEDEEFETTEQISYDDDGDVALDESEVIDANMMKWYCSQV